jgi:chlorophyllide a reductase subunit Y
MLEPLGLAAGPVCRRASGVSSTRRSSAAVAAMLHPSTRRPREFQAAGAPRRLRAGRRGRHRGLARAPSATPATSPRTRSRRPRTPSCRPSSGALAPAPIDGAHHPVRLRGLGAAGGAPAGRGRRRPALRRHRLPATPWSEADREWLEARGVQVNFRAVARAGQGRRRAEYEPDLAIGTTPVVQHAKEQRDSRRSTSPT